MAVMNRNERQSQKSIANGRRTNGNHLFNPKLRCNLVKPDFYGKDGCWPSIFHITPLIDDWDDDKGRRGERYFASYRDGQTEEGFTNWFVRLPVVSFVGLEDAKKTFAVGTSTEQDDIDETLYGVMYRRIEKAVKRAAAGKDHYVQAGGKRFNANNWFALLPGEKVKFPAMPDATRLTKMFINVGLLVDKGLPVLDGKTGMPRGYGEEDWPQLMQLSPSAAKALCDALEQKNSEDFDPDSNDWAAVYRYGDVTSFGPEGKWCVMHTKNHNMQPVLEGSRGGFAAGDSLGDEEDDELDLESMATEGGDAGSGDGSNFSKYEVSFLDKVYTKTRTSATPAALTYNKWVKSKGDVAASNVLKNHRNLTEYFDIPSQEQQALYLASAFKGRPDVLQYGFADTPEFWTSDVKALLASRAQVAVAGNSQDADEDGLFDEDDDEEEVSTSVDKKKTSGAYTGHMDDIAEETSLDEEFDDFDDEDDDDDSDTADDDEPEVDLEDSDEAAALLARVNQRLKKKTTKAASRKAPTKAVTKKKSTKTAGKVAKKKASKRDASGLPT